ncbi:MAG TPA: hypothetical protein VGT02_16975 [Methylomirabilota bacterium]|nr:hypothetical protein [Methylomirabilota bacterium]
MRRLVAAGALALCLAPTAVAAETRPSKPQAGAAVNEYKAVRERCAADDAACEGRARQRFVEVVSCVAHGAPKVNPATLQQDFARYVDLVSEVLDGPDAAAPASPGPCFGAAAGGAAPAGAAPGPAARQAAPAQPADEGPSVESLRRFRKQAEEQSRPVTALPDTPDTGGHANLKAQLEEMRARLRSGDASSVGGGGTIGGGGFVPGVAAPVPSVPGAPPALAAPAPTGTTNISGGPSAPPAAVIGAPTGGPTPPPASGGTVSGPAGSPTSGYVIQRPPGALDPTQLRRQLLPGTVIQGPPAPASPASCPKGTFLCGNRCAAVGTACP